MSNVVEMPEKLNYIVFEKNGHENIDGVSWKTGNAEINIFNSGHVNGWYKNSLHEFRSDIPKNELKQLMIMWLALNYPDCLAIDED